MWLWLIAYCPDPGLENGAANMLQKGILQITKVSMLLRKLERDYSFYREKVQRVSSKLAL
jgi:hypothetical protein